MFWYMHNLQIINILNTFIMMDQEMIHFMKWIMGLHRHQQCLPLPLMICDIYATDIDICKIQYAVPFIFLQNGIISIYTWYSSSRWCFGKWWLLNIFLRERDFVQFLRVIYTFYSMPQFCFLFLFCFYFRIFGFCEWYRFILC